MRHLFLVWQANLAGNLYIFVNLKRLLLAENNFGGDFYSWINEADRIILPESFFKNKNNKNVPQSGKNACFILHGNDFQNKNNFRG